MSTKQQIKPFRSKADIDPKMDGVLFINIYSRAATRLGQKLSHFAQSPFHHPYFGPFQSMEGFWFYMKTGRIDDRLRYMYGYKAKQYGRELKMVRYQHFQEDILAANYQKIISNKPLMDAFVNSTLPFTHYYLHTPKVGVEVPDGYEVKADVIFPPNSGWLIDGFEDIRTALKEGRIPQCWIDAEKRYVLNVTDRIE